MVEPTEDSPFFLQHAMFFPGAPGSRVHLCAKYFFALRGTTASCRSTNVLLQLPEKSSFNHFDFTEKLFTVESAELQ